MPPGAGQIESTDAGGRVYQASRLRTQDATSPMLSRYPLPFVHGLRDLPVELAFDPFVRDADGGQVGQHAFEESRLRGLAFFLRRGHVEFRDARAAHVHITLVRTRD